MESEHGKPTLSSEEVARRREEGDAARRKAETDSNKQFEKESGELKVGDIVRRVGDFVLRVNQDVERIMSNKENARYTVMEVKRELSSIKGNEEEYAYELTLKDNETGDVYEGIDSCFFEIDGKIEKKLLGAVQDLIDRGDYGTMKRALEQIEETTKEDSK